MTLNFNMIILSLPSRYQIQRKRKGRNVMELNIGFKIYNRRSYLSQQRRQKSDFLCVDHTIDLLRHQMRTSFTTKPTFISKGKKNERNQPFWEFVVRTFLLPFLCMNQKQETRSPTQTQVSYALRKPMLTMVLERWTDIAFLGRVCRVTLVIEQK